MRAIEVPAAQVAEPSPRGVATEFEPGTGSAAPSESMMFTCSNMNSAGSGAAADDPDDAVLDVAPDLGAPAEGATELPDGVEFCVLDVHATMSSKPAIPAAVRPIRRRGRWGHSICAVLTHVRRSLAGSHRLSCRYRQ